MPLFMARSSSEWRDILLTYDQQLLTRCDAHSECNIEGARHRGQSRLQQLLVRNLEGGASQVSMGDIQAKYDAYAQTLSLEKINYSYLCIQRLKEHRPKQASPKRDPRRKTTKRKKSTKKASSSRSAVELVDLSSPEPPMQMPMAMAMDSDEKHNGVALPTVNEQVQSQLTRFFQF